MSLASLSEYRCLVSGSPVEPFLNFGMMPIANGFLSESEFESEPFFELEVGLCEESGMVQLTKLLPPTTMFHENYAFFSSTSSKMAAHFQQFADWAIGEFVPADGFAVEMGSNDGILLRHFANRGLRHLGIEPSENVAEAGRANGVNTVSRFFSEEFADEVIAEYGHADVFMAANVMCHIATIRSVAAGIEKLLKPEGVLVFEDPYLGDILTKGSFDQIYDEHAFYFCANSVQNLFGLHGLELIDVIPQPTHGGSMRYVLAKRGARPINPSVSKLLEAERLAGFMRMETMVAFAKSVERKRDLLKEALESLKSEGKSVAGYGATSKSTTVSNYCGITPDLVQAIYDTTPIKQGKFSPGVHIPVLDFSGFRASPPDVSLLFAWNHAEEIMAKETGYSASGGRWLNYVPEVRLQ